jgi:hypothetical protein
LAQWNLIGIDPTHTIPVVDPDRANLTVRLALPRKR